jgi:hypothetical protein
MVPKNVGKIEIRKAGVPAGFEKGSTVIQV